MTSANFDKCPQEEKNSTLRLNSKNMWKVCHQSIIFKKNKYLLVSKDTTLNLSFLENKTTSNLL